MRKPNFFLTIIGMSILSFGIIIFSFAYWLVSNIIAIVSGIGSFFLFIIFLGRTYSYFKDTKIINQNFEGKKANELIISLRKKALASAVKILVLIIIYGLCWGVIIYFLQTCLL